MRERITQQDILSYKREILEHTVLVAPREAAAMLSCSERTVHNLVREGEIHAYSKRKGAKGLRFLASELREYVDSIKVDKERWRE